jgi:tetratricopeptide (TPR) repeat protein
MKTLSILLTALLSLGLFSNALPEKPKTVSGVVLGKWVRMGPSGPMSLEFKSDGTVEVNFGNNNTVDVVTEYEIRNDTIHFQDKKGLMCPGTGVYKVYHGNHYIAFDLIRDDCGGRIKSTMGFWTQPDFSSYLGKLDQEITETRKPSLYLNRARIYMALGNSKKAKADFDVYLSHNKTDARAYINRAGTRFPDDMKGVLADCDQALKLEPGNKNAYFLKGLALYQLGEKEKACENFSTAIKLGFSILKIAEQERCAEFWKNSKEK